MHVKANLLSGGERQALSLIMATSQKSKILLLTEHTSALDPKTVIMIVRLTQEIVTERALTVLMVTHSVHNKLELGDRILVMHHGQILYDFSAKGTEWSLSEDLLKLF
ncbi:hypothetical protein [Pajaroellobacter abortibovis]|uniref:hypothetical protein n=1 Tax=Pajaroellobacter abortibovis TaxID=1882918 RepID=UPI0009FB5E47|nr:hypothetical protein [Pajaroellobacter abortibovis]